MRKWLLGQASNSLTPRTAEAQLNEAAAMSDLCEDKGALLRPLQQWVGNNIVTLRTGTSWTTSRGPPSYCWVSVDR